MDYEQKYKDALDHARAFYDLYITQGHDGKAEILEGIFPELKESEDERIRKKLIGFVMNWSKIRPNSPFDDYAVYTSDSGKCDKILAWLDKQRHMLDPDKVIEWLECKAFQGWGEPIDVRPIIRKFKKDFEL